MKKNIELKSDLESGKVDLRNKKQRHWKAKLKKSGLKNYEIILFPLISEKSVGMIDLQNKLTFVVNKAATRPAVKKAVEELYKVKVEDVKILNDLKGRKKAIVRIDKKFKAEEIATKLGII